MGRATLVRWVLCQGDQATGVATLSHPIDRGSHTLHAGSSPRRGGRACRKQRLYLHSQRLDLLTFQEYLGIFRFRQLLEIEGRSNIASGPASQEAQPSSIGGRKRRFRRIRPF